MGALWLVLLVLVVVAVVAVVVVMGGFDAGPYHFDLPDVAVLRFYCVWMHGVEWLLRIVS